MGKYINDRPDFYSLEPANYTDYRDFLNDRFEQIKRRNPKFSLSACAQKGKISKSLLQFLFKKKRHLGIDRMPALAAALKMSSTEEYYTYLLICWNSSKSPKVKSHFVEILNRLRHQYVRIEETEIKNSYEPQKSKSMRIQPSCFCRHW